MATLVLRPSAYYSSSGSSTWYNQDLSAPPVSTVVDESTLDTADYNFSGGGDSTWAESIRYSFPNHSSESGVISSVAVTAVIYAENGKSITTCGLVRIGSKDYKASTFSQTVRTQYTHTETWSTNPATSSAWTWTNVDDLIAGWYVAGKSEETGKGGSWVWKIYQIYVTVTYTPLPAAPTNVSATENLTDKITITWTAGDGETNGHRVYRDGNDISGVVSHGTSTYDDTGAAAPAITAGSASASNGTFSFKVVCSNSGESIANGTTYSYTVKAINDGGTSSASSADNGYRLAGSLSYQWQVSAEDSDADYSDIAGATSSTLTFYDAPSGVGRYYRCKITATDSTTQYSTAERGFRAFISPIVII
jgi:hypothetical protein